MYKTKAIQDYHIVNDMSALSAYKGPRSRVILGDGRIYSRVTSSTAVDGVLVLGVANAPNDRWQIDYSGPALHVKHWGAIGDGIADDTLPLAAAFKSGAPKITLGKNGSTYKVTNVTVIQNVTGTTIRMQNAQIVNSDLSKQSFLFQDCKDIRVYDGTWGYSTLPTANSGGAQHVFQFDRCQNVIVDNIHIQNSGEMGIAITSCNGVTVRNSLIENTFRDGIYCRYSVNVNILYNTLRNIKDDALSFHDKDNTNTGVDAEKTNTLINVYGYAQATGYRAVGNTISNCYQGVVSVGGADVEIIDNRITNTVLAAIAVYNIKNDDSSATIKRASIIDNKITAACSTTTINNQSYTNNGQSGPGRAAIFVGSTGTNNQVGMGEIKHLSDVSVILNKVYSSGANGFWSNLVDNLTLIGNLFQNGSGTNSAQGLSGTQVELNSTTGLYAVNNRIVDTRNPVQHTYGYQMTSVSGYSDQWDVVGVLTGTGTLNAVSLTNESSKKKAVIAQANIDSNGTVNFNSITTAGNYQVAGGAWSSTINGPITLATAGNLAVMASNDVVTQIYTDYLTNISIRVLNGISAGSWSVWQPLVNASDIAIGRYGIIGTRTANINSSGSTNFNTFITAGVTQVAGGAWTGNINAPIGAATAGNLVVLVSNDAVTQLYTDYLGTTGFRVLNGISSGTWSAWSYMATSVQLSKTFQGDTALSGSQCLSSGNIQTMNLKFGSYAILPAVTGTPYSSNWVGVVAHHEDPAGPGGGTYWSMTLINLLDPSIIYVGGTNGSGGWKGWTGLMTSKSQAAAPTTTEVPAGMARIIKNTTDATVKLYYNDNGTFRAALLM